jgi:energy-coupling factor transporter transmembrane protein EcfT
MDLNFGTIFVGILFSLVGFAAWRYGRMKQSIRHLLLAVALMVFGYFVPNPWLGLLIGGVLTGLLFWP